MADDADTGDLNAQALRAAQSARARAQAAMKAAQAASDAADLAEAAAREAQESMDDWTPVPEVLEPAVSEPGATEPSVAAPEAAESLEEELATGTDDDVVDADPADPESDHTVTDADGDQETSRWRRRPSRTALVATAAVLVLGVAIALNVVLFEDQRDHTASQDDRVAYIQAAKQGVVNMTTIDYNTAAKDVQRVIDGSTGSFRDEFSGRKDSFVQVVQKSKVSTKGAAGDAGIEKLNADGSAVVLVSASSKVTNGAGAKDEARAWRLRVTVTPDNGTLKMSKVDFVP